MYCTVYLQCDARYNGFLTKTIGLKTVLDLTIYQVQMIGDYQIITSIYRCDDNIPLIQCLEKYGNITIIQSDEEDVTLRFLNAINGLEGYIIRVGGDQALLDVEMTKHIITNIEGYDLFYDDSVSNCVLPDVVSLDCLKKHEKVVRKADRYFRPLINDDSIKRLRITKPFILMKCRVNDFISYQVVKNIIDNKLNIYELSQTLANRLNSTNSNLYKNGILSSWFLGDTARDFFYDSEGVASPWWCEAAVNLVKDKLFMLHEISVFEWGAGNSTLFWSRYANSVKSVEYDHWWFQKLKGIVPKNVEVKYCKLEYDGDYCRSILNEKGNFDIILIDGRDRVRCAKHSINKLKPNGIIIWDNSDREYYSEGYEYLRSRGFKRLELSGVLWGIPEVKDYTSFFYRDSNIFGL